MMTGGKADAFALSRDLLPPFVAKLPGSRIVEGGFQFTGVAIAVARAGRRRWLTSRRFWKRRRRRAR